ncbi:MULTISPECIES: GTP-binding protein [unclassified Moorena]|uniref:GTP-binding protein n=1 Tax=unclassified Moorena TaxID=2683338 RepID=UPI0025F58252|nr:MULTISPECIES: GTP-binding protein [unclassified Moorena]
MPLFHDLQGKSPSHSTEPVPLRHIFQLCGQRSEIKSELWSTPPVNQLVFIGYHLDTDKLRQKLNNCLATSVTV